jgi:hypothetical protein
VLLTSPHGNRAVSLQERQAEMLREKIKLLEHRIMDMIRHGNENMIISDRLQRWARRLFLTASPQALPHAMAEGLQEEFMVPQVAVKVWGVADAFAGEPFRPGCQRRREEPGVVADGALCGGQRGFEAVNWLAAGRQPRRLGGADCAARRHRSAGLWPDGAGLARFATLSTPAWAPISWSAWPNSAAPPCRGCVRPDGTCSGA